MSIDHKHMREYVIRPTLKFLGLHSRSAEELLMGTAAQESHMGTYLRQIEGPALGIFQMEPFTHDDCWDNYLAYRDALADSIKVLARKPEAEQMTGNLFYACAMARVKYLRDDQPLPGAGDIDGLARYWKRVYNSAKGAGTVREFVENYERFVAT